MKTFTQVVQQVAALKALVRKFDDLIDFNIENGEYSVPYFQLYYPDAKSRDWFNYPSIGEQLAFAIRDFEYPFPNSRGIDLCDFLEITGTDRNIVLAACCSDDAYESYCDEERRANEY